MYQVWTKAEYEEGWKRKDCDDLRAAQVELFESLKRGETPLLTVEVPFSVNIKIEEGKIREVTKVGARPGEGPGAKGKGKVRGRDPEPVQELGEGSGDPGTGDSV